MRKGTVGTRRKFLEGIAVSAMVPDFLPSEQSSKRKDGRHFHFVYVDVFTSERLQGNPLAVFTDARALSQEEMQGLARETNLQETTFVLPRDPSLEAMDGVRVRIFTPEGELPFAGHPTLGTSMVLRNFGRSKQKAGKSAPSTLVLDLKVGKVPVSFREEVNGTFGEMQQIPPVFGRIHDRKTVADALELDVDELEADIPIQTVSTGLPYIITPLKQLKTLQALQPNLRKAYEYMKLPLEEAHPFYFVTRDTGDSRVGLRARGIYPNGEDPATGSAAGCTSAWMVKYGIAQSDETVVLLQGVEIKRPSNLYVRSTKNGTTISNVRVGGYAVPVMEGEARL